MTLFELKKQTDEQMLKLVNDPKHFAGLIIKQFDRTIGQIKERIEMLHSLGVPVSIDLRSIEKQRQKFFDDAARAFKNDRYNGFYRFDSADSAERTVKEIASFFDEKIARAQTFKDAMEPSRLVLEKMVLAFSEALDERLTPQKFSSQPTIKHERKSNMGTTKVFKAGAGFVEMPTRGDDVASLADKMKRENPTWDYSDCLIKAEKEILSAASNKQHFSQEPNASEDIPQEAIEKAKTMRRGVAFSVDGRQFMKVYSNGADQILECSDRDADDAQKFAADPEYQRGKRFTLSVKPAAKGFSEDGKFFKSSIGLSTPTREGTAEENEAVEVQLFMNKFSLSVQAYAGIRSTNDSPETVCARAIKLLKLRPTNFMAREFGDIHICSALKSSVNEKKFQEVEKLLRGAPTLSFVDCVVAARVY